MLVSFNCDMFLKVIIMEDKNGCLWLIYIQTTINKTDGSKIAKRVEIDMYALRCRISDPFIRPPSGGNICDKLMYTRMN